MTIVNMVGGGGENSEYGELPDSETMNRAIDRNNVHITNNCELLIGNYKNYYHMTPGKNDLVIYSPPSYDPRSYYSGMYKSNLKYVPGYNTVLENYIANLKSMIMRSCGPSSNYTGSFYLTIGGATTEGKQCGLLAPNSVTAGKMYVTFSGNSESISMSDLTIGDQFTVGCDSAGTIYFKYIIKDFNITYT